MDEWMECGWNGESVNVHIGWRNHCVNEDEMLGWVWEGVMIRVVASIL